MSAVRMFGFLASALASADLTLLGEGSAINFLGNTNARLSMSCSTDTSALKWLSPSTVYAPAAKSRRLQSEEGKAQDTTTGKDTQDRDAAESKGAANGEVRARVSGIPDQCEGKRIQTMCYSDDPDYPALVWCKWEGSSANETMGPYRLQAKKFGTSGTQFFG